MQIKEAESKQLKSLLKSKHDIDHINGLVESIMTVIKPSLRDGRDFTHESLIFIQHCHTLHHKDPQGLEALISGDEKQWRAIMQPFILSIQALPQSEVDLLTDRLILAYLKMDPLLIDVIQRINLQAIGRDQKIA